MADRQRIIRSNTVQGMLADQQDLLAEQLVAVERALAYNQALMDRMLTESFPAREVQLGSRSPQEGQSTPRDTQSIASTPGHSDDEIKSNKAAGNSAAPQQMKYTPSFASDEMAEPLLGQCTENEDGSKRSVFVEGNDVCQVSDGFEEPEHPELIQPMFPGMSDLKSHIINIAETDPLGVEDQFHEVGCWPALAANPYFTNGIMVVILLNTFWISIDTDCNHASTLASADWIFQIMENLFCSIFTFEMVVRVLAVSNPWHLLIEPPFLFDTFLVALMIWETWIEVLLVKTGLGSGGSGTGAMSVLRIFRVFRLLRVARIARLMGELQELVILVKGMVASLRSTLAVFTLLGLIIYIFAIIFTQLLRDSSIFKKEVNHFVTVPSTANFLLLQVLCGFDQDFAEKLLQRHVPCYLLYLLYLFISGLTIMNMLIGILCDVVFRVADDEKEEQFMREMSSKVESLAESLDVHGRGYVVRDDFEEVIKRPDVIVSLSEMGVDVAGLLDFAHFVYRESDHITYDNFEHMVVQFRSGKAASLKDVMEIRRQMSAQFTKMAELHQDKDQQLRTLQESVDRLGQRLDIQKCISRPDSLSVWYHNKQRDTEQINISEDGDYELRRYEKPVPSTSTLSQAPGEDPDIQIPILMESPQITETYDVDMPEATTPSSKTKDTRAAAELFASYFIG